MSTLARSMLFVMVMSGQATVWAAQAADGRSAVVAGDARRPTGHPGGVAYPPELTARITARLRELGPTYQPRTRHLDADGSAQFSNRLILQSSPYLLQHAHNPVDWYPWGDEAFAAARARGVPVLLSVGYSTCHWCHVMEEESFEDLEIAAYLNANFVAIKVDREERPDVDAIYMAAVQTLTGRGGWPLNVWLTPERKPFFGGTYFPARDGDRGQGQGFLTVLRKLRESYATRPDEVLRSAEKFAGELKRSLEGVTTAGGGPTVAVARSAMQQFRQAFDATWGGAAGSPKFPSSLPIPFLLRYQRRAGDAEALAMATKTLARMAAGGMYDQIGGGFHRYSTDERWLVPHFEKMLYDNALLIVAYLEGYQATGNADFARVARESLRYLAREMTAPGGAFYSATDADSLTPGGDREEGYYFTWTPTEVTAVLGSNLARPVLAYYAITATGDFEGRSIPHVTRPATVVAAELGLSVSALEDQLKAARDRLYQARGGRPAPLRDDKILAAWNGLAISAFARAALVFPDSDYAARAVQAARFVLDRLLVDGRLRRSFSAGAARHNGYLDDHAFMVAALIDLFEATGDAAWLERAVSLDATLAKHFEDPAGGFFLTSDDHEVLLAREKPAYDGAEPSGNSVALLNLLRLHELTTEDGYRQRAERLLANSARTLNDAPRALGVMLQGVEWKLDAPKQVVIVGDRAGAAPLLAELARVFVPNRVVVVTPAGPPLERLQSLVPVVEGKVARNGAATAYVCENRVCRLPTSDPKVFADQLRGVAKLAPDGAGTANTPGSGER